MSKRPARFRHRRRKTRFGRRKPIVPKKTVEKIIHKATIRAGPIVHTDKTSLTGNNADQTGTVTILSNVAQGSTEHQRRGEETRLLSLRLKYSLLINRAQASVGAYFRMIIFRDTQNSSGADDPTIRDGVVTDLLESSVAGSSCHLAHEHQDTKKRYLILYNKVFPLYYDRDTTIYQTYATWQGQIRNGEVYINLKNVKASYNNTTANDHTRGHVYLAYLSTESTYYPTFKYSSRCYLRSM